MTVAQTNPAIDAAWGVIKVMSGDERARALAEAREKARMDLDSWLGDARYDGRQEGLLEGRQEGLLEGRQEGIYSVAQNALRKKMPHDAIVELTGLSLEEIQRLAAGLTD